MGKVILTSLLDSVTDALLTEKALIKILDRYESVVLYQDAINRKPSKLQKERIAGEIISVFTKII
mgnify:FL=1